MINKKEFDLLLKEIFQIENKIEEIKILNQFDKANEFENILKTIREDAKHIVLEDNNALSGFDDISLEVLLELILLDSEIDYSILKINNLIESAEDNKLDAEILEKIKKSWENLEENIRNWKKEIRNPIEEIEYNRYIGKVSLDNLIYQLKAKGILDLARAFEYCKKEYLINAIKETLFEGAKKEEHDTIKRKKMIDLAKKISEKDLYDYKLWQQTLTIKEVRSRDQHIEIIGNLQEKESKKYLNLPEENISKEENDINMQSLENIYYEPLLYRIKKWFYNLNEVSNQKKMALLWASSGGPAFKVELKDGNIRYFNNYIDNNMVENTKKLIIATNGVAKYNFEKDSNWKNLEEIEFLEKNNTSSVNLSSDRRYNCIGNNTFSNCINLKDISFGKIEMIGENSFENCSSLSELTFPKNIMNIGDNAFLNCKNLKKVTFMGDLKLYILDRPQNILNCFKGTSLEEINFLNLETAFDFAITNCPTLRKISITNISNLSIPFKTCKYILGREEGIVSFIGEKALSLWKKRNTAIRFFELTEEDKRAYNLY